MKIAVLTEFSPFQATAADKLAQQLVLKLQAAGQQAYVIKIPFDWTTSQTIVQSLLSVRLLAIRHTDRVVALDFPTTAVSHPDKCIWLLRSQDELVESWRQKLRRPIPRERRRTHPARIAATINLLSRTLRLNLSESECWISKGWPGGTSETVTLMEENMTEPPVACPRSHLSDIDLDDLKDESWQKIVKLVANETNVCLTKKQ